MQLWKNPKTLSRKHVPAVARKKKAAAMVHINTNRF